MASRPISIEFVAEVAQYLRDTKKVAVSTEDIADALVAVTHDADDLERKLSAAMRDAAKDTEVLERAIKDIPKATDAAADKAHRDFDRLGDDARDAGREVGDEFKQNLGESLASGDLQDIFNDTLGGLVGSLHGRVGAIAAVVAAGTLLVFNKVRQQIEQTNQAIADQTESMWSTVMAKIGEGVGRVAADISQTALVQAELNRLWNDSGDEMQKLVEAAEALGINANDLILARAGDEAALRRVNAAMADVYAQQNATNTATVEQIKAVQAVEDGLHRSETAAGKVGAKITAYNHSLAETAAAIDLINDRQAAWADGVAKTQAEVHALNAAFAKTPNDLRIRLNVDASQLRQYFPYGTVGGTSEYQPKYGGKG